MEDSAQSLVETADGGFAIAGYSLTNASMDFLIIKTNEYGIIPEFPSWTLLLLFLVASFCVVIFKKRFSRGSMR